MNRARLIHLTEAVDTDCCRLIDQFSSMNSFRFSDFASCWRQHHFSHILSGRFQWNEIIEYIELLLSVCTRFLLVAAPRLQRRVAAIYLCYGVYFKLPPLTRCQCALRITRAEWQRVRQLRHLVVTGRHHDAHYCLQMLFEHGAFLFVAAARQMAPDLLLRKLSHASVAFSPAGCCCGGSDGSGGHTVKQTSAVSVLHERLEQLDVIHEQYVAMKTQLFTDLQQTRLDMVCGDTVRSVCRTLNLHTATAAHNEPESSQHAACSSAVINTTTAPGNADTQNNEEDIGSCRRGVRDKAVARFRPEFSLPCRENADAPPS